ncbi:MAG: carboxymuconolactone decarboxylase family protein [Candidatus Limnocylindrales bacterium]
MRSSESVLRKLAIGHGPLMEQAVCPEAGFALALEHGLDERTIALARIAALVALDAGSASYLRECNAALASGVTGDEIAGVLVAVASLTGSVRVIAAAPRTALGLGYDVEAALEDPDRSDGD